MTFRVKQTPKYAKIPRKYEMFLQEKALRYAIVNAILAISTACGIQGNKYTLSNVGLMMEGQRSS